MLCGAPVADQRHRIAVRQQPGTGTSGKLRQQSTAIETHRAAITLGQAGEIADRKQG
jgi:hypothetical protein